MKRARVWSSNDWPKAWEAAPPPKDATTLISVIIPAYGYQDRLEAVLAGLARQTYPRHLLEVVVVDDETDPPLAPAVPAGMNVRIVRQPHQGARISATRNRGVEASSGSVVVFLDSDMIPVPDWLASHAALHARHPWLLVCGFRRHVDVASVDVTAFAGAETTASLFRGHEVLDPPWIVEYWKRHDGGRSDSQRVWTVTSGGNLSMPRRLCDAAGGFDADTFYQWGGEDNEFGYRCYQLGAFVVPEPRALCWHLGIGTYTREEIDDVRTRNQWLLGTKVADHGYRKFPGITYATPEFVLEMEIGEEPPERILSAVGSTLASSESIGIALVGRHDDRLLARMLSSEGRVVFGDSGSGLRRWPFARIVVVGPVASWSAGQLSVLGKELHEGVASVVRVRSDDQRWEAWLVRVRNQVAAGMVTAEEAFSRCGGRVMAEAELAPVITAPGAGGTSRS